MYNNNTLVDVQKQNEKEEEKKSLRLAAYSFLRRRWWGKWVGRGLTSGTIVLFRISDEKESSSV